MHKLINILTYVPLFENLLSGVYGVSITSNKFIFIKLICILNVHVEELSVHSFVILLSFNNAILFMVNKISLVFTLLQLINVRIFILLKTTQLEILICKCLSCHDL